MTPPAVMAKMNNPAAEGDASEEKRVPGDHARGGEDDKVGPSRCEPRGDCLPEP